VGRGNNTEVTENAEFTERGERREERGKSLTQRRKGAKKGKGEEKRGKEKEEVFCSGEM
jgi:hypothetical protein